jgi:hypothetical protein
VAPHPSEIAPADGGLVACFYILYREQGVAVAANRYQAIYLMRRGINELVEGITAKCRVDASKIVSITHINQKGVAFPVDDDLVARIPDGQDMIVVCCSITPSSVSNQAQCAVGSVMYGHCTNLEESVKPLELEEYELRLIF